MPAAAQDGPSGQLTVFNIDTYAAIDRYMGLYPDVEIELIDIRLQDGCGRDYGDVSWNYNAMANDGVLEDLGPLIARIWISTWRISTR